MEKLTCGDCKAFIPNARCIDDIIPFSEMEICPFFETKTGSRPRFCRLASSVDEMADAMIFEWVMPNGDKRYYVHNCPLVFYDWHKAKEYAKAWLMEGGEVKKIQSVRQIRLHERTGNSC